jgi:hypothetical protein
MSKYSEKLKDPQWQRKRLRILERDEFSCQICGDTESPLAVHHYKYSGEPWEVEDKYLKTLCENCHESEHKDLKEYKKLLLDTMEELQSECYREVAHIVNLILTHSKYPPEISLHILETVLLSNENFFNDTIASYFFELAKKKRENTDAVHI